MERPNGRSTIRAVILLAIGVAVISVGQIGRELLPPDDLREAEVGREMLTSKDFVIPHLAGLPFVEKPPAFPAVLAGAYRLAGGPSALVAHLVSGGFALVSLGMVFLLGRRVAGSEAGALSAALLALSLRFVKASHEVHLDNALTAVSAIALTYAWSALATANPRLKKRLYAAVAFSLALAFLVKGFVGPALFGVGFLIYVAVSGRRGELRHALGFLPIVSFVGPILIWVVPFLLVAAPHLVKDFFVRNQIGRFAFGYGTHAHPLYYHLAGNFWDFAPGSVLVPFAAVEAWRTRREPKSQAGLFFLAMSAGPLLLLTASRAKGPLYLLPALPAQALLVGCWSSRVLVRADRHVEIGTGIVAAAAWLFAAGTLVAMVYYGYSWFSVLCAGLALAALGLAISHAVRHHRLANAAVAAAGLVALGWIPLFSGPIAAKEIADQTVRPELEEAFQVTGQRELLLYRSNDAMRGGAGFYRNRTAIEARSAAELVSRLLEKPPGLALLHVRVGGTLPPDILNEASRQGAHLREEARIPTPGTGVFVLVSAEADLSHPAHTPLKPESNRIASPSWGARCHAGIVYRLLKLWRTRGSHGGCKS